jgi:hypothetical protein
MPWKALVKLTTAPAAGHLPGQFQRGLDGVVPGRPGELDLVGEIPRPQDQFVERLQEGLFRRGFHVQRVDDTVVGEVVQQRLLEQRVVVPVVERPRAGEEVEVRGALLVEQRAAGGPVEHHRPGPAVAANLGFERVEDAHDVMSLV